MDSVNSEYRAYSSAEELLAATDGWSGFQLTLLAQFQTSRVLQALCVEKAVEAYEFEAEDEQG